MEKQVRTPFVRKTLFALVVAGLLSTTLAVSQEAPAAKTGGLDVSEHVLDNGLRLLVVNRPGVPLVSSYVWYQVGAIDETPGNTGMAHFLEHMMFKGSKNYKVGEVDAVTVRNGGSNNAFTSNDYTAYYFELPKSRYKEALKIEADRMRHLTLEETEFDSEKKVVQSESDISADDPSSQLWEQMQLRLFGATHPNSHPVLGWPQDVQDITRRDMRLFYDRHYHPNHATLVLVGDITMDEALPTVTELFGSLERGPELKRPQPTDIKFKGPQQLEVKGDSEVIEFARQYLTVRAGHADTAALDVLGMILGSGVTSRLYRGLVEDQRVSTGVSAGHMDQMLAGSFYIWAQLADGRNRNDLQAAVEAEINKLIEKGVTEVELQRTKNRFISRQVFAQESASSLASALGESQTVYGDWRVTLQYPERIRAVTAEDVRRVAKTYLQPENAVTGWLVPELTPADDQSAGPDAEPGALPVKRHVLSNGLTVLLLERRGLPVISVSASVRSGRSGESAAENGLSQFTGWLLDTGSRDYSKQQIAETMEGIGGSLSVDTDGVSVRVLAEHRDIGLEMLTQCLVYPTFPKEEIELAREQVLATLESSKNETAWFARNAAAASLYGADNPLGRPADGSPANVKSFQQADVVKWHQRYFRPDNCILSAVGDFDSDEMLKQIEARLGAWKKPDAPLGFPAFEFKRPAKLEGEQVFSFQNFDPARVDPTRKRILIDHPEKDQVVVRLQTLGITRDNPDYYALLVMDNVLGTSPGFTDRFSKKLRDEMGLAYSTYANISSGSGLYPGAFLGYIGTRPENVELALKTMYELLEEIRNQPVSDEELSSAKDYLKGSFVFDVETTGQLAGMLISMERYKLGFDHLVKYVKAVDAVTADDVQRVARKYLVPGQMVEILAGPVTKITPAPETPTPEDE